MSNVVAEVSAKYLVESEKDNVPAGYKKTEVGVIPTDWQVKEVAELCGFIVPGRNKPKKFDGDIPWVTTPDLTDGAVCFASHSILKISLQEAKSVGSKIVPVGAVILTCVGELGIVAIAGVEMVLNQQLHAFLPSDKINNRFLLYALKRQESYFYKAATKTAVPYLNKENCNATPVVVPPKREQTAIANALSDVDALITSLEKLITKKRAIKTAAMQQLLTGKKRLPPFDQQHTGYKQTALGEIPEDWEVYTLGEIIKGTQLGGNYKNSEQGSGMPLIKMGNLGRGHIKLDKIEFIVGKVKEIDRLEFGDLLFNTRNTLELVGKVAAWRNELPVAYFNSNIMRITFNDGFVGSNFYMNAVMNSKKFVSALSDVATGTTSVAAIYSRDLFRLEVALPSKDEQSIIAATLRDIEDEIRILETRLSKTKKIKQGMMQELLTGRTRLL